MAMNFECFRDFAHPTSYLYYIEHCGNNPQFFWPLPSNDNGPPLSDRGHT